MGRRQSRTMLPKEAPNCNVDVMLRWDHDNEKARLMKCPEVAASDFTVTDGGDDEDAGLIAGLVLGIGIPVIVISVGAAFWIGRNSGYGKFSEEDRKKTASEQAAPIVVGGDEAFV